MSSAVVPALHPSFAQDLQDVLGGSGCCPGLGGSSVLGPDGNAPALVATWEASDAGVHLEDGNVAIGFDAPTANRLDVAGVVNAQGFSQGGVPVVSSPWVAADAATPAIAHSGDVSVVGKVVATEFLLQSGEPIAATDTVYEAGTNLVLAGDDGTRFELAPTLGAGVRWTGQPIEDTFIASAHKWAAHEARLDNIEGGTIGSPWDVDAGDGALVYTGQVRVTGVVAADGFTMGGHPLAAPGTLTSLLARVTALETELANTRTTVQNNYAQIVFLRDVVDTLTGAE